MNIERTRSLTEKLILISEIMMYGKLIKMYGKGNSLTLPVFKKEGVFQFFFCFKSKHKVRFREKSA